MISMKDAFNLAESYGVKKDWKKAYDYYVIAAMQGHVEAQCKAGLIAQHYGLIKEAEKYLTMAISNGSVYSNFPLGEMYQEGKLGGPFHMKKAYKYYMAAAKGGIPDAQYKIAVMNYLNKGVKGSSKDFFFWLGCAYLNGFPKAIESVKVTFKGYEELKRNFMTSICPDIISNHPELIPEYFSSRK